MKERVVVIEDKDIFSFLISPAAAIALIVSLAEILKLLGVGTRFIPLCDALLGILFGLLVYTIELGYSLVKGIVCGLALGLSACGLFSGVKNFFV